MYACLLAFCSVHGCQLSIKIKCERAMWQYQRRVLCRLSWLYIIADGFIVSRSSQPYLDALPCRKRADRPRSLHAELFGKSNYPCLLLQSSRCCAHCFSMVD